MIDSFLRRNGPPLGEMMRERLQAQKRVFYFFAVLFFFLIFSANAQEIIKNPKKPLSENAGRILRLEEQLRITDESGEFFLELPSRLKVSGDGSIFFYDREQLIHLDREGRFIRNFYRKGQGPGELSYVSNFLVLEDTLIVHNNYPNKIVWFDLKGELVKELSLRELGSRAELLFYREGTFYLIKSGWPARTDKMKVMEIPFVLTAFSEKTHEQKELISFPLKALVMGGAWVSGSDLISVPYKDRYLFVSHTREYMVQLYDCKTRTLLRRFNRAYKRIRRPRNRRGAVIIVGGKRYEPPGSEFLEDIIGMFMFKDRLWVRTSTTDEKKGYLYDVFDFDGRYVDAFYLPAKGSLIGTHEDSIFVRERTPDELVHIVKYRVSF